MQAAIAIAEDFLLPHALAAFALMAADLGVRDARHLLRWLERHAEVTAFTRRGLHQALRRGRRFDSPEALDAQLGRLERHGFVRGRTEERTGPGRRTTVYEVHRCGTAGAVLIILDVGSARGVVRMLRITRTCPAGQRRPQPPDVVA
jgi:hypothetical protein